MPNQITYDDKVDLNIATDVQDINKVTAADMNEIKTVVNSNSDYTDDLINAINNPTYTTTEGTDLSIDNTRVGKMKFEYYGDTEQETTTGKNLFDGIMESGGIAAATGQNEDLAIRIRSKNMVAISGSTFTISCVGSNKQTYIYCYDANSSFLGIVGNAWSNFPYTFTVLTNTAYIRFTVRNSNNSNISPTDITNVQVEQGSPATSYEPYTGGIPSPNPDYPQEVKTITGENNILIVGKNQIGPLSDFIANNSSLQVTTTSASITVTHTTTQAWIGIYKELDNLIPNTTMTLSVKGVTTTTTGYSMTVRNSGGQVVQEVIRQASGSRASFSFTVPSDGKIIIRLYAGYGDVQIGDTATYSELQLEKGTTVTSYEPYQGQSYELNLGANVVDCSAFNTTTSSGITVTPYWGESGLLFLKSTGTFTATSYFNIANDIKFQPNTKYTINKSNYSGAQYRLREYDANNTQLSETFCGLTDVTITSNANVHHAVLQIVFYTTLNSFFYPQITKGTTAKKYQPYFTPIELCKIGDYQDYIYDNGGKWYLRKENGKVDLATLSWTTQIYLDDGYKLFFATINDIKYASNSTTLIDNYSEKYIKSIASGMSQTNKRNHLAIDTDAIRANATDYPTGLFYYPLATPTDTEITNTALINQLNAIKYGAESYYGQTNIIITSEELQPTLKVQTLDKIGD